MTNAKLTAKALELLKQAQHNQEKIKKQLGHIKALKTLSTKTSKQHYEKQY